MLKHIKIIISLLLITLLNVNPIFAVEKNIVSLEEAKELAVKNSRGIQQIKANIELLEAQENIKYDSYDTAQNVTYYDTISRTPWAKDTALDQIKASKKVWEATRDSLADAKVNETNMKDEIKYTTERLYIDILKLENNNKNMELNYQVMMQSFKIEKFKKELGMVTDVDVNNLGVQVSDYNKLINSQKDLLTKYNWVLNETIGRDINDNLQLVDFEVNIPTPIKSVQSLIETTLNNYYSFNSQERDINKLKDDLDDIDTSNEKMEKQAQITQAELALESTKSNVRDAVKLLASDYDTKAKAYNLARRSLENAQKTYEWQKKKYELGCISQLEFKNAEYNYNVSLNNKVVAGYDYFLAKHLIELAEKGILVQ